MFARHRAGAWIETRIRRGSGWTSRFAQPAMEGRGLNGRLSSPSNAGANRGLDVSPQSTARGRGLKTRHQRPGGKALGGVVRPPPAGRGLKRPSSVEGSGFANTMVSPITTALGGD